MTKTQKNEMSSKRVRKGCEPHMYSVFLPLPSSEGVETLGVGYVTTSMRHRALLCVNSGGNTVFIVPSAVLSARAIFQCIMHNA